MRRLSALATRLGHESATRIYGTALYGPSLDRASQGGDRSCFRLLLEEYPDLTKHQPPLPSSTPPPHQHNTSAPPPIPKTTTTRTILHSVLAPHPSPASSSARRRPRPDLKDACTVSFTSRARSPSSIAPSARSPRPPPSHPSAASVRGDGPLAACSASPSSAYPHQVPREARAASR